MTRSPGRICWSPRGTTIASPRMIAATLESAGISAFAGGGRSSVLCAASAGTSSSTIWTLPSANMSVWRAAGSPSVAVIAFAVSSSGETMKSTSRWRSRQASRYALLVFRTIVCAPDSRLASIAPTRLASSRGLQPMNRSASSTPAMRITRSVVPSPSTVRTS